jgi:hypothetical protein
MKPRDGPAAEADLMKARSGRTPDLQPSPGKARYPPNGDIHSAISDVPLNVDSSRPHSANAGHSLTVLQASRFDPRHTFAPPTVVVQPWLWPNEKKELSR